MHRLHVLLSARRVGVCSRRAWILPPALLGAAVLSRGGRCPWHRRRLRGGCRRSAALQRGQHVTSNSSFSSLGICSQQLQAPLLKLPKKNKAENPQGLFAFSCSSEACLPFPFVFDFLQTSKPRGVVISAGCRWCFFWCTGSCPGRPHRLALPGTLSSTQGCHGAGLPTGVPVSRAPSPADIPKPRRARCARIPLLCVSGPLQPVPRSGAGRNRCSGQEGRGGTWQNISVLNVPFLD